VLPPGNGPPGQSGGVAPSLDRQLAGDPFARHERSPRLHHTLAELEQRLDALLAAGPDRQAPALALQLEGRLSAAEEDVGVVDDLVVEEHAVPGIELHRHGQRAALRRRPRVRVRERRSDEADVLRALGRRGLSGRGAWRGRAPGLPGARGAHRGLPFRVEIDDPEADAARRWIAPAAEIRVRRDAWALAPARRRRLGRALRELEAVALHDPEIGRRARVGRLPLGRRLTLAIDEVDSVARAVRALTPEERGEILGASDHDDAAVAPVGDAGLDAEHVAVRAARRAHAGELEAEGDAEHVEGEGSALVRRAKIGLITRQVAGAEEETVAVNDARVVGARHPSAPSPRGWPRGPRA
jgi:hypothetical protein